MEGEQRPWGSFEVLSEALSHKVKRIVVSPGRRFSLQRHHRRSEHWHIVEGRGLVTLDERSYPVGPGDTVDVPVGAWHRMECTSGKPLVFIEVQRGEYFGEDDIDRKEDDFGRTERPPV